MERRDFTVVNDSEANEALLDAPVATDDGEQLANPITQVERLADSLELHPPMSFSHEAYYQLRDSEAYVIRDDLRPALKVLYQPFVVENHEAAREQAIEIIDTLLARADEARIRFEALIAGARQMPEYVSAVILQMAQGGESAHNADDQTIAVIEAVLDLLEAQRDDVRALKQAGTDIAHAMNTLEVSSQFLAACIQQAQTPTLDTVDDRRSPVRVIPPMPLNPPRISEEARNQSNAPSGNDSYVDKDLGWSGPTLNLGRVIQKRTSRVKVGR